MTKAEIDRRLVLAGLVVPTAAACSPRSSATRVERNSKRDDVNATPTFVVNGRKLEAGYQPLRALEDALARA